LYYEGAVPYRPLGKSKYKLAPWVDDASSIPDDYIPTEMSVGALKIGLEKYGETRKWLDEQLLEKAVSQIQSHLRRVWTRTPEEYIMSFEEACDLLVRDKSPGYPYYYKWPTKGDVLDDPEGVAMLRENVNRLLNGDDVPCIFSLTEKTELRLKEKVQQGKTRIFAASDMHHLVASKMLFEKQNNDLVEKRGKHPITIGIQVPGPEFVHSVVGLGDTVNDGDLSGCDIRFPNQVARKIRDLRSSFLPARYDKCAKRLYDAVYAGSGVILGGKYHLPGNKSGWENTGHDNSLQTWIVVVMGILYHCPESYWADVINLLINGDDLLAAIKISGLTWKQLCDWIRDNTGVCIEADNWEPRKPNEVVFLSHHIEERYVHMFGDFTVAAGNLRKLRSSINWVQTSANLTLEESCVAHLVGVRMCLFPWQVEFEECDSILANYLKTIEMTPFIEAVLFARFDELSLARLHTKCEGSFFLPHTPSLNQVLKWRSSLIKEEITHNDTNKITKGKKGCGSQ
jgi:hypothetical protein